MHAGDFQCRHFILYFTPTLQLFAGSSRGGGDQNNEGGSLTQRVVAFESGL
jgi:hypothetical protein